MMNEEKELSACDYDLRNELNRYLSAVSCGILQYTKETYQITYANDIALRILGYDSVEELQKDFKGGVAGTVNTNDMKDINHLVTTLSDESTKVEYHYRVTLKDGRKRVCYGAAKLIKREGQEPLIQRTIIDITDAHNQSKSETESLLQAYQSATGATGDVVFVYDFENNTSVLTSSSALRLNINPLVNGVPYDITKQNTIAPESIGEFIRVHEEMKNGAKNSSTEVKLSGFYDLNGYFKLTFQALFDKEGNPTKKAVGIFHDITNVVEHDIEQLKIIETLGGSFSSIYYVDLDSGKYKRIKENETSALVFPAEGLWEEGFAKYVEAFAGNEYRHCFKEMIKLDDLSKLMENNEKIVIEYQRNDEGWRRAFMLRSELTEEGKLKSAVFAVQNIQEDKKKELDTQKALREAYSAAQMASAAKTTFLSNMSHDIRTPLNAIIGMTAVAGANLEDPKKISDCLKKITSSGKHLLGLINQILDMSKIESGKIDLNEEEFNISDLLDEVINMNHVACRSKNHELKIRVNDLLHENVIGDRTRLEQVFNNMLSNAIKYTPEGGKIEIIVSEKETNKPNVAWYEVTFSDNGIGMSKDFIKTIFEPFARASDERAYSVQGTGLGMPIARNIIRMMNGDIEIESELNKGSSFKVSFALRVSKNEQINYDDFIDLPVLVVDDDEIFCENTCVILDSLSMKSEYVTSGYEAIDKTVERHKIDDDYYAIIMDWKMPDIDGVETTRRIREKIGNEVPIIVLTAYDWSEIEEEARDAGVNAFINKPLFRSKIVEVFKEFKHDLQGKQKKEEPKENEIIDFSGKRILLVEDNELNTEIAVELLSATGVEIETAENGKIAFEMLISKPKGYYNLVFMDIQMPIMNGYEATKTIRAASHPDAKKIPIVAMTANAFSTDVRAAFDAGMNGHISKPIDMGTVIKTMKKYLG